jgi:hypothetical protein
MRRSRTVVVGRRGARGSRFLSTSRRLHLLDSFVCEELWYMMLVEVSAIKLPQRAVLCKNSLEPNTAVASRRGACEASFLAKASNSGFFCDTGGVVKAAMSGTRPSGSHGSPTNVGANSDLRLRHTTGLPVCERRWTKR